MQVFQILQLAARMKTRFPTYLLTTYIIISILPPSVDYCKSAVLLLLLGLLLLLPAAVWTARTLPAFFFWQRSANLQDDLWTNSAIPIVQQRRGALIYKYHCADLYQNIILFYNRMKYNVVRTSLSLFSLYVVLQLLVIMCNNCYKK